MQFEKATPIGTRFKASMYGPPGSGKTFTSLLIGEGLAKLRKGRMAVIDTENGTNPYTVPNEHRAEHPDAFDFDVIRTRSLAEILSAIEGLDPKTHPFLLLDSVSHIWDAAREAWEARNPGVDDIPLRAWGPIKKPYKRMMKLLIEAPLDIIICGRQKTIFSDDDGRLKNDGVGLRAEGETQYEPDLCFRMALTGKRGDASVPTMFCEKDRWSVFQGRTYAAPNFQTIAPILPFLGDGAPRQAEDDEERALKDGELLDDSKVEKKKQKSAELLARFQAEIAIATTAEEIGKVQASIKKEKRYMTEDHLGALRQLFDSRRDTIVAATMGEV